MKLREILGDKKDVRIREYEKCGDNLIFIGGCFYNGKSILPLDGGTYPIQMEIGVFEWEDANTLMIVR